MPMLNREERVKAIMTYMHQTRDGYIRHSADSLSRELQIPSASVRRTIYQDYPECFIKDRQKGIILSSSWPHDIGVFTMDDEPKPVAKEKPFHAKYLDPEYGKYIPSDRYASLFREWLSGKNSEGARVVPIAQRKEFPQEFWDWYNGLTTMMIILRLIISKDPEKRFKELVSNTDNAHENFHQIVKHLAAQQKGTSK